MVHTRQYSLVTTARGDFEAVRQRTIDMLAKAGFGVLTEIDVTATLRKKLGVEFRPYVILGACNPPLAHRALCEEQEIGVMLPCNVVIWLNDDHTCTVAAMDPVRQFSVVGNPKIEPVAVEVQTRLRRVLEDIRDTFGA